MVTKTENRVRSLKEITDELVEQEEALREPSKRGAERQHRLGRLLVRERLLHLLDPGWPFFEVGLWAAHNMYPEWGEVPAAGTVAGIGRVNDRWAMVIANDATVKAGAFFPQTVKKLLRAQRMAYACKLPVLYLVDSAGVFLPLQDEIFPDEDDFGRIFRNNSVLSAEGIPQFAAVMGNCIAGGSYLPVLCDKVLMTEGSGLYLAGPALVKAAIGQEVDTEELGGAKMHADISGTVDFHEEDDPACLERLRSLMGFLPKDPPSTFSENGYKSGRDPKELYDIVSMDPRKEYDMRDVIDCLADRDSFEEYKATFGKTIVCGYATIGGQRVGIVANQRKHLVSNKGQLEIGGVIYAESSDKAARFVMDCNQIKVPILFLQDVMGFMVGKDAEQGGIIRSGAKLVNAISNAVVPKITVVVGHSFGAGNYAMCGKAYDPTFIVAWPNSKYAVMGADQAADTLFTVQKKAAERAGKKLSEEELKEMHEKIKNRYQNSVDIRYGAARGWVDAIIEPHKTRELLRMMLELVGRRSTHEKSFHCGVIQT